MLKAHRSKKIFLPALAAAVLCCAVSIAPVTYAWNGATPEVLFSENFSSGYSADQRISQNSAKLVTGSTDSDKWSSVTERVDGGGTAGNTASFKTLQDPDTQSGHGMVMAMYSETPSDSATPNIRKFFQFNNGATALDIEFSVKVDTATFDAMSGANPQLEFALDMPGYTMMNATVMQIKNKLVYLPNSSGSQTATTFTDLTQWNKFRLHLYNSTVTAITGAANTAYTAGAVYVNEAYLGTIMYPTINIASPVSEKPALTIKATTAKANQLFYLDDFSITEVPFFSANFNGVSIVDGQKISAYSDIYAGSSLLNRWNDKLNFLVERTTSAANSVTAVLADDNGNNVLKFVAGSGVVNATTGEPESAEPLVAKQVPMPNTAANNLFTYTIKFSVKVPEGVQGPRIRIGDGNKSTIPATRDLIFQVDNGNTIKIGNKTAAVATDADGWSHYVLTLDITNQSDLRVDCVQNGEMVIEDAAVTHSIAATSPYMAICLSGGFLWSNQYMYYDDISIEGGYNSINYGSNGIYAWDGVAVQGTALASLTDGSFVGKASVKNSSYSNLPVYLVTVLYENGKLESIDTKPVSVPAYGTDYTDVVSEPITVLGSAGKTMRVFLWNDLGRMIPLNAAGGTNE